MPLIFLIKIPIILSSRFPALNIEFFLVQNDVWTQGDARFALEVISDFKSVLYTFSDHSIVHLTVKVKSITPRP